MQILSCPTYSIVKFSLRTTLCHYFAILFCQVKLFNQALRHFFRSKTVVFQMKEMDKESLQILELP